MGAPTGRRWIRAIAGLVVRAVLLGPSTEAEMIQRKLHVATSVAILSAMAAACSAGGGADEGAMAASESVGDDDTPSRITTLRGVGYRFELP